MGYEDDTPENAIKNQFKRIEQILNSRETLLIDQIKGLAVHIDDTNRNASEVEKQFLQLTNIVELLHKDVKIISNTMVLLEKYLELKDPNYKDNIDKLVESILKSQKTKPRGRKPKKK